MYLIEINKKNPKQVNFKMVVVVRCVVWTLEPNLTLGSIFVMNKVCWSVTKVPFVRCELELDVWWWLLVILYSVDQTTVV